jgi:hypothetical protein
VIRTGERMNLRCSRSECKATGFGGSSFGLDGLLFGCVAASVRSKAWRILLYSYGCTYRVRERIDIDLASFSVVVEPHIPCGPPLVNCIKRCSLLQLLLVGKHSPTFTNIFFTGSRLYTPPNGRREETEGGNWKGCNCCSWSKSESLIYLQYIHELRNSLMRLCLYNKMQEMKILLVVPARS